MTTPQQLANTNRAAIIAPAGYGKTQLIAETLTHFSEGRQLILTHTHAGVTALKKRLKKLNVSPKRFNVETIAGIALRYTAAYPKLSELKTLEPRSNDDWNHVYKAFLKLLKKTTIQKVIRISYDGFFVDEYQDCGIEQHELVLALASLIPCRLLGDPLQGIFEFSNSNPVIWERDVQPNFESLPSLETPWRWCEANPELGDWLKHVRQELQASRPIDLRQAPSPSVSWIQIDDTPSDKRVKQISVIKSSLAKSGTTVAIHKWASQCYSLANYLSGTFQCLEAIDLDNFFDAANSFEKSTGINRVEEVCKFATACATNLKPQMTPLIKKFKENKKYNGSKYTLQCQALASLIESDDISLIKDALEAIRETPDIKIYRRETFNEMLRVLEEYINSPYETLTDAAHTVRERTRRFGRPIARRTISTTLLVKGLEFDHSIILDAKQLDVKNIYVAMTRGSQSLTVLSSSPLISTRN